jgi:cytoskeletal protein RodZ
LLDLEDNKLEESVPKTYAHGYQKIYAQYLGIKDQRISNNNHSIHIPKQTITPVKKKDFIIFFFLSLVGIIFSFFVYYIYSII